MACRHLRWATHALNTDRTIDSLRFLRKRHTCVVDVCRELKARPFAGSTYSTFTEPRHKVIVYEPVTLYTGLLLQNGLLRTYLSGRAPSLFLTRLSSVSAVRSHSPSGISSRALLERDNDFNDQRCFPMAPGTFFSPRPTSRRFMI